MARSALTVGDDVIESRIASLEARAQFLETRLAPGPRDPSDRALVHVLGTASCGERFTAAGMWRRALVGDVALADALATCDMENAKQLGKLLRRLEGIDVDGVTIHREGSNREGLVWRARVRE